MLFIFLIYYVLFLAVHVWHFALMGSCALFPMQYLL